MHDPMTLVMSIKKPIPRISKKYVGRRQDDQRKFSWQVRLRPFAKHNYISPFIYLFGYELYFEDFLQVWHTDPLGDAGPACHGRKHWKWHIHHMSISPSFWYDFRQKHIARCAYCGKKSSKELGRVNHSNGVRFVAYHSSCMSKMHKEHHEHDPRGCYACSGSKSFDWNRNKDSRAVIRGLFKGSHTARMMGQDAGS